MVTEEVFKVQEAIGKMRTLQNRLEEENSVRGKVRSDFAQLYQHTLVAPDPDQQSRLVRQVRFEDAGIKDIERKVAFLKAEHDRTVERLRHAKERQEAILREYEEIALSLNRIEEAPDMGQQVFQRVKVSDVRGLERKLAELAAKLNAYPPFVVPVSKGQRTF